MKQVLLILIIGFSINSLISQTDFNLPIESMAISGNTGEKPQSKIWEFEEEFYSVFPISSGTYIWKLSGNEWIQHLLLTPNNESKADCFSVTDTVFILLFQGQNSEFTAVKFNESTSEYQFLNSTNNVSNITFDSSVETATIAFDSESELWISYESNNNIEVRKSITPYDSWSTPVIIETNVASDDISSIVKMNNSVGVLWSNQNTELFGFKYHNDGDPISNWSSDESPGSQSALNVGNGMADDHINLKFTLDNILYAAIKTSYDNSSHTRIGLLVRQSDGIWDSLYHVSFNGTRPILSIDTESNSAKVYYTFPESGGDIKLRESNLDSILFGEEIIFLDGNNYNNASTSKFPYGCNNVVIAKGTSNLVGNLVLCQCPNCYDVTEKVTVENSDLYISDLGKGILMRSVNNKCWKISVNSIGELFSIEVICPE